MPRPARLTTYSRGITVLLSAVLLACTCAAGAAAATPAAHLTIQASAAPTAFSPEHAARCITETSSRYQICDTYRIYVTNTGDEPTSEEGPTVVTFALPPHITLAEDRINASVVSRRTNYWAEAEPAEGECNATQCELSRPIAPDETVNIDIAVTADPEATTGEPAQFTVTENGREAAHATVADTIEAAATPFGPQIFTNTILAADGTPETQAGAHPYEMNTNITLNTSTHEGPGGTTLATSVEDLKDVVIDLPIGYLGSARTTPKCTFTELAALKGCPPDTRVGHLDTRPEANTSVDSYIYNMIPEEGNAAEYGYVDGLKTTHAIYANVTPTPSGYVLRAVTPDAPQVTLQSIKVVFFGEPQAKQEDGDTASAMFTNPTQCTAQPLKTTIHMDSWQNPGATLPDGTPNLEGPGWVQTSTETPAVTGCNLLRFQPTGLTVKPDETTPNRPTGLTFDLKVPQSETPGTLATPPLRDATVTLPAGLSLDPSAASALQSCTEAQIGWLGTKGPHGEELPELQGPEGNMIKNRGLTNFNTTAPECPKASDVGSVEVESPITASEHPLKGTVYLAAQQANPYGSLLAGYIVIDDPATGVLVKVPGELKANESTGQITGVFTENPQLPFSDLKIHFTGGERGDLATPEACGTYTSTGEFTPWSAPDSGPAAVLSDNFTIGGACSSPFTPAFTAGTTSNQAGGFGPFTLSFGRENNEQALGGLSVTLPTGLTGRITGVAECTETQVHAAEARSNPGEGAVERANPSCPETSLLGTVSTTAGPGSLPYTVAGKAYLTGPYKGAPYGIAVIVPAVAGPFDLGVVVIRQALYINPTTAQITDVSDPFPTIEKGIPLRIDRVNVTLNRPGFTLNPTSCAEKTITATGTSTQGTTATLSSRYQAAGCANLAFTPKFTAAVGAKASRALGASLTTRIEEPAGALGTQANITKARVQLPKQLPSQVKTLKKACRAATFEKSPEACTAESPHAKVGEATVHTPLLPDPLTGNAYLVSHGGEEFPSLTIVLKGDNVTFDLVGATDITNNITTTTFKTVPDVPFTSFELKLPQDEYAALGSYFANPAANNNFCTQKLIMPTELVAQNGAVIHQETRIRPEGCSNTISTLAHSTKGRTLTAYIYAPAAGKLTITGRGVHTTTRSYSGPEAQTINITQKHAGRLHTKLKITYTPSHGNKQHRTLTANYTR